jgi:hypothetical protein
VTRFIALIVGIAAAVVALYVLAQGGADSATVLGGPPPTPSPAPLDEVDDTSRALLEGVLREAERADSERAPGVQGDG